MAALSLNELLNLRLITWQKYGTIYLDCSIYSTLPFFLGMSRTESNQVSSDSETVDIMTTDGEGSRGGTLITKYICNVML